MLHNDTSRRALLGGAGLAMMAVTAPIARARRSSGSDIERHWRERCLAYREFETDPDVPDDAERTQDYWDRIDVAEIAILNSPDRTLRAAELRLWVAWSHNGPSHYQGSDAGPLVAQGDFAALQMLRPQLDWSEKMLLAAIGNLRGED